MKRIDLLKLMAAFLLLVAGSQDRSLAQDAGTQIRTAIQQAAPSVVRIRVIGGEQTVDGDTVSSLAATGVVIAQDGKILSSSFAFQGRPTAVSVETTSGERRSAKLIATDHVRRLVLLQADGTDWQPATPVARDQLQVGQQAIALGRFYDSRQPAVSSGIVSALNRIHGRALQTDAKVSPVNYGGALINLSGAVMGILVPLSPRGRSNPAAGIEWYDSGIGFAIPMSDALSVAARLQTGQDLLPGVAGLQLTAPGPFSDQVSIRRVQPQSPAQKAGIRPGDKLLQAADRPITRVSILEEVLAAKYAGETVELTLQRNAEQLKVSLELVDRIPATPSGYAGLILPAPDAVQKPAAAQQPDLPAALQPKPAPDTPVLVQTLPGTPAALAGLPPTVELTAINEKTLKGLRSFLDPALQLQAGSEIALKFRTPGSNEEKSLQITASPLPDTLPALDPDTLHPNSKKDAPTAANTSSREELPIEGQGNCVVIMPPQGTGLRLAPVILLSADSESEAAIIERWNPLLADYHLMLIIPRTIGRTPLTADDAPLVLSCLQLAASKYSADTGTPIILAAKPQLELAWQFTSGNSRVTADLVLQSGWISDFLLQDVSGTGRSVLLFDPTEKTESRLLLDRSRSALQNAGFWVPKYDNARPLEQQIAAWTVLLRAW